jgi:hypothetical protein
MPGLIAKSLFSALLLALVQPIEALRHERCLTEWTARHRCGVPRETFALYSARRASTGLGLMEAAR